MYAQSIGLASLGQGHQTDILDFLDQLTAMGYVCSSKHITPFGCYEYLRLNHPELEM